VYKSIYRTVGTRSKLDFSQPDGPWQAGAGGYTHVLHTLTCVQLYAFVGTLIFECPINCWSTGLLQSSDTGTSPSIVATITGYAFAVAAITIAMTIGTTH
jgi:hypothetical protein